MKASRNPRAFSLSQMSRHYRCRKGPWHAGDMYYCTVAQCSITSLLYLVAISKWHHELGSIAAHSPQKRLAGVKLKPLHYGRRRKSVLVFGCSEESSDFTVNTEAVSCSLCTRVGYQHSMGEKETLSPCCFHNLKSSKIAVYSFVCIFPETCSLNQCELV